MASRPRLLIALAAALTCASACTKTTDGNTVAPALDAPASIDDLDDFARARNAYALLPLDAPERERARATLVDYLVGYVEHAVERDQSERAVGGLEQLAGLWRPRELGSLAPNPDIARVALAVYTHVSPAGDERPALLALALAQAFASADEAAARERDYAQLAEWVERTSGFSREPQYAHRLEQLLEDVSGLFPSPFLIDILADRYLDRYRSAQQTQGLSEVDDPRVIFAPYLLARLYLLADDLDTAAATLERLGGDESMQKLRANIEAAKADGERATDDLDQLIAEFLPAHDHKLPDEIARQSWVIVDNLAQRSLAVAPDHAPAHLARGRVLRERGYYDAAIVHYERAFAGKARASHREDLHRAWTELAELYQLTLEQVAEREGDLRAALTRVEQFHERAAQTWPQRKVTPDITRAWMVVASAEFNAGHIDEAEALLDKVVVLGVEPQTLDLLATIALRRGQFDLARQHYEHLEELSLSLEDQLAQYDWQIESQLGLAEVELLADKPDASVTHLREALRHLNTLLSYVGLPDGLRVEFGLRRAQVFFWLGEIELAMEDVRTSQRLAPEYESAYTRPLMFTVIHGHFEQAREIFEAALANNGGNRLLSLYYALWLHDLAGRVGHGEFEPARAFLERYAADEDAEGWQRKLAAHALGELDGATLVGAADSARERSEAYFYTGLARWTAGRPEASLDHMAKVLDQQMMGDFEYVMAQSYLRFNELPKTARAALEQE